MPFVPLADSSRANFPRVSPAEQARRDSVAEQIVGDELSTYDGENPQAQAALEAEYQSRFGKPAPIKRGFVPLDQPKQARGFIPLAPEQPSVLKTVALENPATAIGETALNLGSQMVALPIAGNALGITDKTGADVVHSVGEALTYQPRGEFGKAATDLATKPFQMLAEAGQSLGGKVLDATGSPLAATVVDTAINAAPMAISPVAKAINRAPVPIEGANMVPAPMAAATLNQLATDRVFDNLSRAKSVDEFITTAAMLAEIPVDIPLAPLPAPLPPIARVAPAVMEARAPIARSGFESPPAPLPAATPIAPVVPERITPRVNEVAPILQREAPVPQSINTVRPEQSMVADQGATVHLGPTAANVPPVPRIQEAPTIPAEPALVLASDNNRAVHIQEAPTIPADPPVKMTSRENRPVADVLPENRPVEPVTSMPSTPPGLSITEMQALIDGVGSKKVSRSGVITETGESFRLEGLDAGQAIKEVRDGIEALEALRDMADTTNIRRSIATLQESGKLPDNLAEEVRKATAEHAKNGYSAKEAAIEAAGDVLHEARKELKDVYTQVGIDWNLDSLARERPVVPAKLSTGAPGVSSSRSAVPEAAPVVPDKIDDPAMRSDATKRVQEAADPVRGFVPLEAQRLPDAVTHGDKQGFTPLTKTAGEVVPQPAEQAMASGAVQNSWAPGANYVPMVDQVRAPAANAKTVADLPDPLRREQIIKDLAKALDSTVYEGRIKGNKKLGFFRPKVEEVRIKNANDIEVAGHELAHLIDFRIPELRKAWHSDKALAAELRSVSYDLKDVREGLAEGVRLWMTQPETLEAKAPRVFTWLNDFADQHAYGPALRKAQADMTAWFGQDALNRARSKIGTDKPLAEYFDRFFDKFRQSTVDDLHGIYNMERSLKDGKIAPNGAYESARLSRASASIADGAVRFGYPVKNPDGGFTWKGQGLEEILKPVAESMDDALLYFVGRSSHELMIQGREHLFTRGEIDAMLKLKTPERAKAFQDYQAWNKGILDFAEAQGVINPESRRLWQRTQYLPFHRVGQPGGVKGKPGDWAGVQALTGGTTNIKDVLGNMVGNAAMLIDKAVKNEARLKVADLADKIEGAGKFMVKIDAESRPVKISGDQVLGEMLKKYGIAIDGDAPAFFEFLIKGQPPAGNNVVAVLRGGKPTWYEVGDPILYRALMAIDRQPMQWLVKLLSIPKRIGQTTITLTPDFMIANIARDTIMGSVMSRAGFRPIVDSLQGMRLRLTNDPIYKDYIANGGGLSSIYLDETALRTKLERFYGRQGIDYRTVLDTPSKMLHGLETIADAFEVSTRLGEYRRAIQRGENPRHAAYLGRDVSTDFAMRGDSKVLGALYDTVMFLRPAVVSLDRLVRGVAHDPNRGAIAAKAGMVALASAALYLMNKDEPRYADLPDWDRDANWHFFVGEHHFRYPKIWEIGALASTAERTVEKILAEDPAGLGKDFARILAATFNWNLTPQIAAPLIEQATNRNSFTKAPLETPGMENVQPFLRAKPGTSETMKAAGMLTRNLPEGAQINPVRAEALLRGYFNTYAMYGLMLTDKAFFGDKLPAKRTDEFPVVRRFYANEPAKHTKYESEFYNMLQEAKRLRGTMKELDDMGLREMADQKEKEPLSAEAKPLERAAKSLSGINKDMEAVRNDNSLTPAEKRAKLDALTVERNALLKAAVTDSKNAQKAKP